MKALYTVCPTRVSVALHGRPSKHNEMPLLSMLEVHGDEGTKKLRTRICWPQSCSYKAEVLYRDSWASSRGDGGHSWGMAPPALLNVMISLSFPC